MKNFLFIATLVAAFSFTTVASTNNYHFDTWTCKHCEKDHTCDDKCKKGKKGECCDKAKAANKEASEKEAKSCCKKGQKSCEGKKAEKKEESNNATGE